MGLSTEEEITNALKKKDLSKYSDPSDFEPLAQGLWILAVVKDNTDIKRITAKAASFILSELKEINLGEKAILRALARAGDKVKTTKEADKVYYEIMASGRTFLEDSTISPNKVLFFTGKAAWTDPNKNFPKIIELLKGDLCIVDPYYGNGTFFVLDKFGKNRKIRFLSERLGNEELNNITIFDNNLKRFKKEFKNIELKRCNKKYELHDRYIIADNGLVVIGHGLKDLAEKESFVIFLPEKLVRTFLPTLKAIFEARWKTASNVA